MRNLKSCGRIQEVIVNVNSSIDEVCLCKKR